MFYLFSKKMYISDRYLWTEEELNAADEIEKEYQAPVLSPYKLKKMFPVKKILKEREKYYKDRLNKILNIERELTIKVFETRDYIQKEKWRCIRDGFIPVVRAYTQNNLEKVKHLIAYYERL